MKQKKFDINRICFDNNEHWSDGWYTALTGLAVTAAGIGLTYCGLYKLQSGEKYLIDLKDRKETQHMDSIIDYYRDNYRQKL